jgi:hypothetical protein
LICNLFQLGLVTEEEDDETIGVGHHVAAPADPTANSTTGGGGSNGFGLEDGAIIVQVAVASDGDGDDNSDKNVMDEDEDRVTSIVVEDGNEEDYYYDGGDEEQEEYFDYDQEDDNLSKLTIDSALIERVDSRSLACDNLVAAEANGDHSSIDFVNRLIDECRHDLSEAQKEGKSLMKNTLSGKKKKREYVSDMENNDMISDEDEDEDEVASTLPPSIKRRAR